jgi:proteasome lid subunit RPN8/RPN11
MRAVLLGERMRGEMVAHAREAAPDECCGLLVGAGRLVMECVRVRNVDPAPATRYRVDPAAHIALNRRLRGTGRQVIGCYHSHPHSAPVPSEADHAEAYYPEFIWLIVSLRAGAEDLAAYVITGGRLTPVEIRTSAPSSSS